MRIGDMASSLAGGAGLAEMTQTAQSLTDAVSGPTPSAAPASEDIARFEASLDVPEQSPAHLLEEALHSLHAGNISPAELYQLQFSAGILKVQGVEGNRGTEQITQGVNTLLKQQG